MAKGFSVGMISLGCPKNQVDGEALLAKLSQAGYNIVNTIEASDVMIVNTCGFICLFIFVFWWLHPWHVEVPRLRVQSEL